MVSIYDTFIQQGLKAKMLIQVHDELNFDVSIEELDRVKLLVVNSMENAVKISVPLLVEINDGSNWLEAH
jgi:DNA polymerase-1